MAWLILIMAGICEMLGVVMINKVLKDKTIQAYLLLVIAFASSFILLFLALKTLPMGVSYAVWTGIGAAGGAILGMIFYQEPKNWQRIFFILLILVAVAGLKMLA